MIETLFRRTGPLIDSIKAALTACTGLEAVYSRRAPADQSPPFIVFLLRLLRKEDDIWVYDLTVECSDFDRSDSLADDLADAIADCMDYYTHTDQHQSWETWVSTAEAVEEPNKQIQRRRITLSLRYVPRRGE